MEKTGKALLLCLLLLACPTGSLNAGNRDYSRLKFDMDKVREKACEGNKPHDVILRLISHLSTKLKISLVEKKATDGWIWMEFTWNNETYPLIIDVLASRTNVPKKAIYLVSSSGFNFKSAYFTPESDNIAHFFRENGYLVIGITPREDAVPLDILAGNASFLENWGIKKHRKDMRRIVSSVQECLHLPAAMLGHGLAGACVLDYAAVYNDLQKIIILDFDTFNPVTEPEKIQKAIQTCNAFDSLMDAGVYGDSLEQFKQVISLAALYPSMDSGVSREIFGLPGDFTLAGLAHFMCIYTSYFPGIHTPYSGLPGEWSQVRGTVAGTYEFRSDPLQDVFQFTQTDMAVVQEAVTRTGTTVMPIALLNDYRAITANLQDRYPLRWAGIRENVVWLNTEFSYGNQMYGAELIRQSGNNRVITGINTGYAHVDQLWGRNARQDVWEILLP